MTECTQEMTDEERMAYDMAGWRAEWAKRKSDHSKGCLERNSTSETYRPSAGTCGRHIFPGEEVVVFVSPVRHIDGDYAHNFILCTECAPTYRDVQRATYAERAGEGYRVGGANGVGYQSLIVRAARCHTCGYH